MRRSRCGAGGYVIGKLVGKEFPCELWGHPENAGQIMSPCACSLSEKTKKNFQKKSLTRKNKKGAARKSFWPLPDRQHRLNHVDRSAAHRGRSDLALSDPPS